MLLLRVRYQFIETIESKQKKSVRDFASSPSPDPDVRETASSCVRTVIFSSVSSTAF